MTLAAVSVPGQLTTKSLESAVPGDFASIHSTSMRSESLAFAVERGSAAKLVIRTHF